MGVAVISSSRKKERVLPIRIHVAGLEAVTIVWIAAKFTEEHRATLDWLNEHTDEQINFFGLEIELWRIGESPIAPKFNLTCQPNDWSRTVRVAAVGEISGHGQLQLRFWTAFKDCMEKNSQIPCPKPLAKTWMDHSLGRSGFQNVAEASDGLEAVAKAAELQPDLVLLDIGMPNLDGIKAAAQIRAIAPEAKILFEVVPLGETSS